MKKTLRSLIFQDEPREEKKQEQRYASKFPESSSFPSSQTPVMEASTATATPVATTNVPLECGPHMDSVMKTYEDGFAKLNRPGIEFFEYFEGVVENGIDNPQAYQMALRMLAKLEKTMTKDSLLVQSQYYIDELTKVHAQQNSVGMKKRDELMAQKAAEDQKLKSDVQMLRDQIQAINSQISAKEAQIANIDSKYQPQITELGCKLMANDTAKDRILGTINRVVAGIRTNLQ